MRLAFQRAAAFALCLCLMLGMTPVVARAEEAAVAADVKMAENISFSAILL